MALNFLLFAEFHYETANQQSVAKMHLNVYLMLCVKFNQSIYLQKQAASETTVHRAGRP